MARANGIKEISREAKEWIREDFARFADEAARRTAVFCAGRKTIEARDIAAVARNMGYKMADSESHGSTARKKPAKPRTSKETDYQRASYE